MREEQARLFGDLQNENEDEKQEEGPQEPVSGPVQVPEKPTKEFLAIRQYFVENLNEQQKKDFDVQTEA